MGSVRICCMALVLGVAACGTGASNDDTDRLAVVATTTVLADFAQVIGGDRVQVTGVQKPNVDPHDFELAPADLEALAKATVIVANGAGLEPWLADAVTSSETSGRVIELSEAITLRKSSGSDAVVDPHVWHDPQNAMIMVRSIADAFSAADPPGAADYARNLSEYLAELDSLDRDIAASLGALSDKRLVTNHDVFGYFAARYGFTIIGSILPSFDTSAELSPGDLRDLVAAIKANGVRAIFPEASLPDKTAKAVAAEAKVRIAPALYGDGLGPPDSVAGTYLTMMRYNTTTIEAALR
jgi:ABC-type Zn uptake system ZnuABC Zn-binding protein ZnuA